MVYVITHEQLVDHLCDECRINELPEDQQGSAASAALTVRMNMSLGMDVNSRGEIDSTPSLRGQAHDIGLTYEIGNSFIYPEEITRAAIECGRCRKLGECPVNSLVKGTRDESKSSS